MALGEALLAGFILAIVAGSHLRAMARVRHLQALGAERQEVVARAHNLAERVRAGVEELPLADTPRTWTVEKDAITLEQLDVEATGGAAVVVVAVARETVAGPVSVRLPVVLNGLPEGAP